MDIELPSQKTFTSNGKSITIQAMTGSKGLLYFGKLLRIVKGATQGIGDTKGSFKDTVINFGQSLNGILSNIDPEELVKLSKGMLQESLVTPVYSEQWFDSEFSANYDELLVYLAHILNINYASAIENFKKKGILEILLNKE